MTLASTIIRDAYRESNLIPINREPTAAEQDEGLRLFNQFILSLVGNEIGDELNSLPIGRNNISFPSGFPYYETVPYSDWIVPINSRLFLNLTEALTVYLHPAPKDGARFAFVDKSNNLSSNELTVNANGMTINGSASLTFDEDGLANEYFFRADTGDWTVLNPLVATDEVPFPQEFDTLLTTGLAIRLNPRNGVVGDDQTVEFYRRGLKKLRARYNQPAAAFSELGLRRTSGVGRGQYTNDDFFLGRAYASDFVC